MQQSLPLGDNSPSRIVGVDEAGRGALIGNVVAAAVILPKSFDANLVADSKSLSENQRERNALYIKSIAIDYAIGVATAKEIDDINIHHATLLAMQRAVLGIKCSFDAVWVDGKYAPDYAKPTTTFIKGDSLHACISAASILAKTYRDAELRELDSLYPEYGFARHKGYPTQVHQLALKTYGILPEHRRSYKTVKSALK